MKLYTVHLRSGAPPLLVREGFNVSAMLCGPLWFLYHRAWLMAAASLLAWSALTVLPGGAALLLMAGLCWIQGLFAEDCRRWEIGMRGYDLAFVVMGADHIAAWARLLDAYPGLRGPA